MAGQTQRGRRPEGQTRPSEVRALRASQDPAWSEPSGQDKTQCGQRPEGQTRPSVVRGPERSDRPSEVRALRVCEEQTRTCATARRPECQQARVPRNPPLPWLFFQAAGVTFQLLREGASGLSFCCVLPPSLLSSFVFPCCFPGCCPEAGGAQ